VHCHYRYRTVFARLHEPFLRHGARLLIAYLQADGEHRLYLLVASRPVEKLPELQHYLKSTLKQVPGVEIADVDVIDLEIILNFLKSNNLRYCIVGPAVRLLDYCSSVLAVLRPIDRTDLLNRMGLLEHSLKTTIRSMPHVSSTRSIELLRKSYGISENLLRHILPETEVGTGILSTRGHLVPIRVRLFEDEYAILPD